MKILLEYGEVSQIIADSLEAARIKEALGSETVSARWYADRECFEVEFLKEKASNAN